MNCIHNPILDVEIGLPSNKCVCVFSDQIQQPAQLDGAAPVFAFCMAGAISILTSKAAVPLERSATRSLS